MSTTEWKDGSNRRRLLRMTQNIYAKYGQYLPQ